MILFSLLGRLFLVVAMAVTLLSAIVFGIASVMALDLGFTLGRISFESLLASLVVLILSAFVGWLSLYNLRRGLSAPLA